MKRLAFFLIITGFLFIIYSGYSIHQSSQHVEKYEPSNNITKINNALNTMDKSISEDNHKVEKIMSNEIDRYEPGEEVAKLKIPKLNKQFTTYWSTEDKSLDKGVGMYTSEWTVTPDYDGHVVLSGHRDTVFLGLDRLKEGDMIKLEYDEILYEYEITETWITDPDDRSVIVDKEEPTLTLTTCYPFDFIGAAPERYIIQAKQK